MKKLNGNTAMALLRGAIVLAGCMTTVVAMLFCNNIYGVISTALLGSFITTTIIERIKQ